MKGKVPWWVGQKLSPKEVRRILDRRGSKKTSYISYDKLHAALLGMKSRTLNPDYSPNTKLLCPRCNHKAIQFGRSTKVSFVMYASERTEEERKSRLEFLLLTSYFYCRCCGKAFHRWDFEEEMLNLIQKMSGESLLNERKSNKAKRKPSREPSLGEPSSLQQSMLSAYRASSRNPSGA